MAETLSTLHPKFAVVGHPNKGKSSIVSALAMDDSVQISDTPGTTTKQRSFPLTVDGKILYELFDTPGFQRARRVLAWLEKHDVSADKKYEVVKAFINAHKEDEHFRDEVALLRPIMDGAGIIYVVDGSKPYGKEYEAEMEVLRWTGQPSMALINHIEESDYSLEWERALEQYFKMVRTFNPMETSLTQHMSILESMAQLKAEWVAPVKASMKLFEQYQEQMLEKSASLLTRLVYESTSLVEKLTFKTEDASDEDKEKIDQKYKNALRKLEIDAQNNIEHVWNHDNLELESESLTFEGMDLFSQESASVFGLTRKELIITGATSGAVTGAGIDLLFAGHTLLLGGIIGGVAGGVGAYFGFDELSEVKVLGQTLGKRYLQIGPMDNRNFPYILLGRALYHTQKVSKRSHALRGEMDVEMDSTFKDKWLDDDVRKSLEKYHNKFRSGKDVSSEVLKEYEDVLREVLKSLIHVGD
jgi:GTPase Era involved in 16S rRNA processing